MSKTASATASKPAAGIGKDAAAFLAKKKNLLIGGKWVAAKSGKSFDVVNPATEEVISQVAEGAAADIDLAVTAARRAFLGPWALVTPSERGRLIWKLADLLEKHAEEFAQLETLDNGKPIAVCRAADVPLAIDLFRYMAGWATKIEGETIPLSVPNTFAYTRREPVGVVGQIIPWNFPLLMAAWKLGPALATGNTVVLKPAEQTPLTALRLGELICEAGFPEGVVNIVTGFGETAGARLAAHEDVDKIAFTGSTAVGKLVTQAALGNLKKVTLELGGKSPNVVVGDCDIDKAIAGAASAVFFNQGQVCCAGSRLYVQDKIFDRVAEGIAKVAAKIKVGDGMDPATEMGPLVSDEQFSRVTGYLDAGRKEGAKAVAGGGRLGKKGYFVQPTLLTDVNPKMKVVREEIFGPVITAQPFKKIEDLPSAANDTNYGLAAGIWTNDLATAHRVAAQIKAGTVWVNCYNVFDAALPFGGYKESGWGREMGHEVLHAYTQLKSVVVKL